MTPHRFVFLALMLAAWPMTAYAATPADPVKLASVIDARLSDLWTKEGVRPAVIIDDAAFLRRATLDLIGRVPSVAEVREFLADKSPDKRAKLLSRLIESGGHARHMATVWRRSWVPQADTAEFARLTDDFESWVATKVQENVPYDRVVRELLTTPVRGENGSDNRRGLSPAGFFAASENKPDNLAANAARAFLGVNLDCAQCHDHPFARWTRNQFWETAAFFAPPVRESGKMAMPATLMIPNTKKSVSPAFIDGGKVNWPEAIGNDTGRRVLSDWMTGSKNPYFARNAVNRLWAHVYGNALVEPLDDLSGEAGTSGPNVGLLTELSDAFVASGHDLKFITKALTLTKAYQLSVVSPAGDAPSDPRYFARMPVRGLTGEQLYDSLRTAAGRPPERNDTGRDAGLEARRRFASQFRVGRPAGAERSIIQALAMMNGRFTADLTEPANNPTLAGLIDAPFLDTRGRIETLFMATVGRPPSEKQAADLTKLVDESSGSDQTRVLGDLFWALVNTTEFTTNH
ncbi:DUF1549 domain-containing protein [Zavarzinella formosa]|uniref:DUF1549 domain-containing protein n=1 Tax=Zavarzinella formosa TaxID=360055 RepID=UPI00030BBFB9|nr:DUF1549 domain-containing protein [Zavarzinella formosa]